MGYFEKAITIKKNSNKFLDFDFSNGSFITQGSQLSYSAASFGDHSKSIILMNKSILSFNKKDMIIIVEPKITLGELYNFLIQHDLYLPIQPGHPSISIGGCVAANVHGKNQ